MKILRFLGVFGILCAFVFSAQTTYAGSTSTVGDDQSECSNGICQVCEEGKSGDCTNICDSGYWGIGGDMSECTLCATNPGGGFNNTLFGAYTFNRTIGTCYKYCATGSCTDISDSNHSAWSGYGLSGISITPFDSEAGTRTIGFYQFNSNPGGACNTGTDYCPIIMRCSGTSSACKPRTNPVVFKDGNTTLGTLYVVRQTMWSSQNTNFQDDMNVASYSGVVFPIFHAPNAPEKTGYDFIGYYTAQTGGTQVIGADGQLTQSNAALAEAQGTLYAQYRERCETEIYLDGNGGTISSNCTLPFYPQLSGNDYLTPLISDKCMPTNPDTSCVFTGFYWKNTQYYDENLGIQIPIWDLCSQSSVTLTAGWECAETYTVQCPSASDPNTMYSIGGGNLVAGETFSINESNMLKACYHTCGEHQEQSGWDVYLNDSLTPTGTLTGYPITFVAGETYGTANPITLRAHCVDKDFTITYKCGTGTGNGTQNTATVGASYTVLGATSAGCSKTNYTLFHWNISTGGTLLPGDVDPWTYEDDLVLTAEWIGTCNLITFDDNNAAGTNVNSGNPQRKRTGNNTWHDAEPGNVNMCGKEYTSTQPQVSVPTNGNAIFRGYFAPNDSTNAIFGTDGYPTTYGNNWTITSSIQLKALWNCPTGYTWNDSTKSCHEDATCSRITFADNNGNTPSINADLELYRKSDDTTHWYGDDKCSDKSIISDPHVSVPTWSGYNFAGYYTMSTVGSEIFDETGAENTTSTSNWNVSAPIELQAQWTAASSKVIYKCSTDGAAVAQDNATYGQPYNMLSGPELCPNTTQQFTKWRAVNDGREYLSEQPIDSWDYTDGTVTFVAQWEQLYLVRCPSRLDQNTMYLLDGLTYNEVGTWTEADMDKGCYKTCGDAQEFTGWDVYLNDSSSPTPPPLTTYPISITGGVTYGTANPITLRAHCESVCYMVDFDDTTNGGTSVNNSPFYKIAGQSTWYSDNKCSEIVSDPTVSTPTKENADFIGYDDAISQPGHRIFNSSGGITSTGTSWTISQPTTLYAQYECYEGYHLEGTACVPCDDGEFWNGTSCEACSTGAPGFPKSISPYNWSKYQCYRECSETCQNFNITQPSGYSNIYSISKFAQNNKQVEFYGNASANDNLNTCSTVTYCPYVVSENSHLPYKVPSVPISFYSSDNYNTAFDAYHIVGVSGNGANAMLDVSSAFEWSQIVGLGQKLYKNNNIAGQYISTPIFYPVSLAPINEPQGLTFNGYYNPRPATGVNPTAYIGSNRAIGISIAQNVLNGISGNIQDARPLYAQSGNTVYNIIYVMNGGTNYDGAPTSYEYGTGATIDGVPTRNLSEFLGWCTDSALTDCHDEIIIGPEQTGDVTVYASWECVSPYHQNSAGTACEACDDNLYWNGTSCVSCPSSFPHSKQPFTWSEKACYRECPNNTVLGAAGQTCNTNYNLYDLTCGINVGFTDFTGSAGKQIEFKGNYDANLNTCNDPANTYCPRGLFGCGNIAYPFKSMTTPVNFYDATGQQNFGSRYIFGSRGGYDTIDLGLGKLWSFMAGPGQKSDVLHNNVGGVMMDYQYTHIIYPTYLAPNATEIPGMDFSGYYSPRTNGTRYVESSYALNNQNAQSVVDGTSGDSNTARSLYANYSNIAYTLRYNCGSGGTGTPPATVTGIHYGDSITPAANTCSNPGHEFGGWIVSPAGGIRQPGDPFTWEYTADQLFTADWSGIATYNIHYVMNGGTNYSGAPTSYVYGIGATIDGVPTRNLSEFLGWCTDSALTDCHDEIVIGPEQTGDVTVYASWECVSPYHQNSAGTACEACGDNLYWNGTSCVSCPSSFPHSKQPFTWSEKTCYRECPSNTTLGAPGQTCNPSADLYGLNCPINVNFAQFTGSTGKQVEFKGNYDDGTNTCNNADNTYCPRGLFCGGMAEVFKPMTAPVKFYDANEQQVFGTRYIFGSRGGAGTIDLGTGKLWSLLAGSGQKSDIIHNNVGGVMMDYQYTHIIYPTYLAPTASEIPGMAFNGYYYPRTNGTQYVADGYALNSTNAQSVLGGPVGNSNIARKLYANYSNVAYTLTYNCGNGGTGTPPSTVNGIHYGDSITPAANTCSNPGHNFGGWVVSPAGGIKQPGDTFTWQYTNDQVFTANWGDSVVYHINYELYGGTNYAGAPTTYTYETGVVINGVPTRDNSVFNGWCTDAALQNCAMTQTISHETGDKTFYARWKCESGYTLNNNLCNANTITLIYDANGHGVAPTQPSSCEYGSVFMLPAAIVPNPADGYTFNKWTVNGGNFNAGVQIACDYTNLGIYQGTATITATWLADGIIIDWNENGGTELLNGSCVYDGDLTLANAPMYSGYTFNGWLLADGTTYANAASTKLHGCVDTYIGVTSGTSTKITAQWCKNCTQPAHGTCTLVPNMNGTCTYSATCEDGYELSGNGTPTPTCTNGAYAITYRPNGGTPSENITQTIGYLASFVTKDGNTFTKLNNIMTGWTKVSGGNYTALDTQYTYDVTTNTILDAAWGECICNKGTGVTSCTTSSSNNRCRGVALCDQGYINPVVTCSGTTCESACSRCPSGQISNGNDCEPCPAGTYQFGNECRPCANGYISTAGSTSCEPCENGYSSNADHTACEPNVITIVYANGGHGTAPAQTTCTYSQQFTLPSAMTDNGYTFQNWTVNGKLFNADERIVCNYTNLGVYTGTATITGTWGAGKYTVSFDANGGTGGQSANVTATYNQAMPRITSVAPVKVGHTFMGWYDNANYLNGTQYYNANGQSAHVYDKNSDTTLYAGWSTNVITINYSNGGHGTTPNSTTCTYGNSVVLPGAIIAEGFTFANWTVAGNTFNANATVVCNIDNLGVDKGTATITAQWNSKTYRVTYNCGMGSGSAPNAQTATYNENFTPATNTCYFAGHTFTGWLVSDTTDIRDANVSFKWMYAENKTLTAQWSAQSYGISYEMNGGTNYAGAPTSYVYGIGTTINGTPTRSNSVFKGWCVVNNSNCAMTQTIGRTDVGDKMFYAKWVCDSSSIPNDDNTACTPCPTGTHVENGQCVENEDFNTCHLPDAIETKRVWNASIGAYGPCMVVTCANDYHLVANTCVKDFRECQLSNGYGTQEWNGTQWGKCIPTLCDSGFEIVGDNCEECSNRRLNGEVVVSTYANGCEIATCMYHGQKYTLDNNECLPICETKSDETGSMVWNESRKKCVRTCNPGYKMW
ncbi:MAG: InlB B-repeat-containing protein [Alphaproteobacteria bacterium]|nr:InlB B-repeat-containing protein [Alphaproteobacteria bacterium]